MTSIDQLGTAHTFLNRPQRIISLVPSITELLCDLGLSELLVGCTKFCLHPRDLRSKIKIVGGTKNVKLDIVASLHPDIIIANKEENQKIDNDALSDNYPTWISDIKTVEDSYNMITELGMIFSKLDNSQSIIASLQEVLIKGDTLSGTVAYLIWKDPFMASGGDTYIDNMLMNCGLMNVFKDQQRYPEVTLEEINAKEPDYIFLSSEPFPFQEKHIAEIQARTPGRKIVLVDGEYFSWYGTRLLYVQNYMQSLS